jgi:hypothetical protein
MSQAMQADRATLTIGGRPVIGISNATVSLNHPRPRWWLRCRCCHRKLRKTASRRLGFGSQCASKKQNRGTVLVVRLERAGQLRLPGV